MTTLARTKADQQPREALAGSWIGRSVPRLEDATILTGRARYLDDQDVGPGTCHAAILRSPHPHARIRTLDARAARALDGVVAVLTGEDLVRLCQPLPVAVKTPLEAWPIAIDRVRYVGEPVAVIVARDRYRAEDGLDLIEVGYDPLPAVVDPIEALATGRVLHPQLGSNCVIDRSYSYGDPKGAFARAARVVSVEVHYPRNSCTPIECYGIIAAYDPAEDAYEVRANFQGPFSLHPVMARALKVSGNRLRLRTPSHSGGSFGIKQGIAPYIVLIAAAARLAGRPVKWVEDRLEHLSASVSATNRVTRLAAALDDDGRIRALEWDQIEDCGAHLRAPEPATLYRMHGNMTGAYDIRDVAIRNRVVLTNKMPTGLNRGFGGPQVYYALERLMQRIAVELELDPVAVIRRNLIPATAFPYQAATGGLLDSGAYQEALDRAIESGGLEALRQRQAERRAEGRRYGIGYAAVVEPSVSNMGYITAVLTPEQRQKAGPKNGAQATATVSLDAVGSVTVQIASAPQGQGHQTVAAQVVADALGLSPDRVRVIVDLDTAKDAWSIASGNYSSRFAPAVAGAVDVAARRLRSRLAGIAAARLNVTADDVVFEGGQIFARNNPDNALPFARLAALPHWSPGSLPDEVGSSLRETVFLTPEELTPPDEADRINSSLCHGFIFDFCGVEIDPVTAAVRIDRYVSMHDCGRILNPALVDGQIRGGFAQALGAALFEEYAYGDDGSFLSGTFADYLVPTVNEVPDIQILHMETPSPFTALGAKGVGEGNSMSTPVCIANAVADALGAKDVNLPLTPAKLAPLVYAAEPEAPRGVEIRSARKAGDRNLSGRGETRVKAAPQAVWDMLLEPKTLGAIIPGAHEVRKVSDYHFQADVTLGIGPVSGRYRADVQLSDLDPPSALTLSGRTEGALGFGEGQGRVSLEPDGEGGTRLTYRYEAAVGGKVAAVGGRLLDGAARRIIAQFFSALARQAGGGEPAWKVWLAWLRSLLGRSS